MNGKILRNYSTKFLDGDELIFGEDGRHAYVSVKYCVHTALFYKFLCLCSTLHFALSSLKLVFLIKH